MPIPLFGFSPNQPQIRGPSSRPRPDVGDRFISTFVPAFSESAQAFRRQQMQDDQQEFAAEQSSIDRAFRARQAEAGRRHDSSLQKDRFAHTRSMLEAQGAIRPATQENLELAAHYLGEDVARQSVITGSDGKRYLDPAASQVINEQRALDVPVFDPEPEDLVRSVDQLARQTPGVEGLGEPYIQELTTGGEDERLTPRQRNEWLQRQETLFSLMGIGNERLRLWASAARSRDPEDLQAYRDQIRTIMDSQVFWTNPDGEQVPLDGEAKANFARQFANAYHRDGYATPSNLSYLNNFEIRTPQQPDQFIDSIDQVVKKAISSNSSAHQFNLNRGSIVWERVKNDPEGKEFASSVILQGGMGLENLSANSDAVATWVQDNPTNAKALYMMYRYPTAEDFENAARQFGGYQNISHYIDGGVVDLMKKLNPQNYGDLDVGALNYLSPGRGQPAARRGGALDPVADRSPAESVAQRDTVQQIVEGLEGSFTMRLRFDPAAEADMQRFLSAVSEPDTGPDALISELEESLTLMENAGIMSEQQAQQFREQMLPQWRLYIESNSDAIASELVPRLRDALHRARQNNGRQ